MAFHIQNWSRVTTSGNEPLVNQIDPVTGVQLFLPGCYRIYSYYGVTYTAGVITGDGQALIAAASYFNDVSFDLQINDLIIAYSATDGTYQTYQVTQVTAAGVPAVLVVPTNIDPVVRVSLTSAQLLALNATPVQILAAPGAGLCYQVTNWAFNMITAGAPTVYANGGAIGLEYGNTAALAGPAASATIPATVLTTGTPNNLGMAGGAAAFGIASALKVNTALFISNDTAAFINGTGTAVVSVNFSVVVAF